VSAEGDHAALMDGVYRWQRHIYDLTRKYYLFGRDRLIDALQPRAGARIVEVGCGTARNLIRMARRYPDANLFGLDASEAMLDTARKSAARSGFAPRIRLAQGYAESLGPALFGDTAGFDEIVFSYSLSMIPDWKQALASAARSLREGGRIHIVDFGDFGGLPTVAKSALLGWLRLFHVEPRAELLRTLERIAEGNGNLQVYPGRYAFLLTCPAGALGSNFSCVLADTGTGQNPHLEG
jgi:S-adenosylmethionine-diacylgycerolhomoserine-N-methlytransferase